MGAIIAKLSKHEWKEVRAMSEKGHTDHDLSVQWGVSRESIRKRRCDDAKRGEKWNTPKEKEKELAIKAVEQFYQSRGNGEVMEADLTPVTEAEVVEMRSQTPQILARRIHSLLRQGIGLLRVPVTLDDFNKMYSLYQKMLGLDKQVSSQSLHIHGMNWSSSNGQSEKPVVILEAQEA